MCPSAAPSSTHETVLDRLDAVRDTISVSRVFGAAYEVDGATVIPVASVRGGGGGVGFGVTARPVGVYVVKDGRVTWQPSVDVMRIVLGGQILGLVAILTIRKLLARR